jgi:nicotinamide riboside kinase
MKVSISGSFCSGKSTLALDLHHALSDSVLVPEVATASKLIHPTIDWRLSDVRAYFFWTHALEEMRYANRPEKIAIFDGSTLDVFAHSIAFNIQTPAHWFELELAFDLVIVCDHRGIIMEDNGIRERDPELQRVVYDAITERVRIRTRRLLVAHGDRERRLADCLDAIANLSN